MGAGEVVIVSTGTANLASVTAAFRRIGVEATLARSPEEVRTARRVVLPGVGAFGAAMEELRRTGMDTVLRERLSGGGATLMICLGMQLLAQGSEESPGVAGLGVITDSARHLPDGVRRPQLGWNMVTPEGTNGLLRSGRAYYANSFCLSGADSSWAPAWSDHGGRFLAAIERGPQLACQFHPELSAAWGQELLTRWIATC